MGPESTPRLSRGDGGLGRGETRAWKDMDVLGTGELWGSLLLILTCFHKDSSQSFGEGVGLTQGPAVVAWSNEKKIGRRVKT